MKSIIGELDFLVGERTHSVIGSVSVATPFVALTSSQDYRTHGIIGDMSQCQNQIININVVEVEEAIRKTLEIFDSRQAIKKSLQETSRFFDKQLSEVSKLISI